MANKVTNSYDVTYSSYSGCDIIASITIPQFKTKPLVIGELQTISYSIHREVVPVRTLGRANPKGFTAGTRTIAGSLIFTVFDSNLVHKIVSTIKESYNSSSKSIDPDAWKIMSKYKDRIKDIDSYAVMDEMPPFDVTISFTNEYGNNSMLVIKGVVIVDEGQVMSIEDMITENTMSYMATDIQVLKDKGSSTLKPPIATGKSDTALSDLNVSAGTLTPAFDPATTTYSVTLPEGTTAVPIVTATPRDSKAKLTIVPATKIPGTTSVAVVGEDSAYLSRYKINFKTASQTAALSALTVNGEAIEGFDPEVYEYMVTLDYSTKSIPAIVGTPESSKANVSVNRTFRVPGSTVVTVTAEDGYTQKTYTVSFVYDEPGTEARLSMLAVSGGTLAPAFSSDTYEYTVALPSGTKTVPVVNYTSMTHNTTAHITQAAAIPGDTVVLVTAEDGVTQKTYTIHFVKG